MVPYLYSLRVEYIYNSHHVSNLGRPYRRARNVLTDYDVNLAAFGWLHHVDRAFEHSLVKLLD